MNPLLAYDVLALIGVAVCVAILRDRPTRPTPRITTHRDVTTDVVTLERPAWLDQPDDTETRTYRARRRPYRPTRSTWSGPVFPDPPPPAVFRVPRVDPTGRIPLTTSVALTLETA